MICGGGTAQTDEAIIAEYGQFLDRYGRISDPRRLKVVKRVPIIMSQRIGKGILDWKDEDIIPLYQNRAHGARSQYNIFLSFLLFRGYRRASMLLLEQLDLDLCCHWTPLLSRIDNASSKQLMS